MCFTVRVKVLPNQSELLFARVTEVIFQLNVPGGINIDLNKDQYPSGTSNFKILGDIISSYDQ
jgi:hypothetical protein